MADFGAPPDPSYHVPTIDMSRWTSGTAADRAALAAELDAAACTVGFLQLINHSIPPSTLAAALAAADAFYALPAAEKALVVPPSKTVNRGYSAPRSEALALSLASAAAAPPPRPDTFEAFTFGEDTVDYALPFYAAGRERFFAPNIWPARPAGFRGAVVEYFEAARALGHTLTDVFAVALGLEAEYFRPLVDRSTTTMRVLNYDPAEDDAAQGRGMALEGGIDTGVQLRMGAHTDYGMLTVLYADRVHGLQIFDETGVWRSVLPEPGAILINFGDMMAEMTNDRWKSTYAFFASVFILLRTSTADQHQRLLNCLCFLCWQTPL
jgi:isopenicillin N synthase-like dioxygenase